MSFKFFWFIIYWSKFIVLGTSKREVAQLKSDTERSEDEESEIDDLTADLTKVRGKAQVEKRKMKKRDFFDSKKLKESNEKLIEVS